MYYHASQIKGITCLEPRISNHGVPLIYFSKKRENTLAYLSNAVEKYCKETGFEYGGTWKKWGSYGFTKDGILQIQEYYPDAIEKTYRGVSGYIYSAEALTDSGFELQIPDAATSSLPVEVTDAEFIPDAYDAIISAQKEGLISILRYEEASDNMREWIAKTMQEEYDNSKDHPEYRYFLKGNFPFVK